MLNESTTVLFIDPSQKQRTYWVNQLESCSTGYEILEASDGESGLALCRSRRMDCVVLELSLPDHEGFKTLIELVPSSRRPHIAGVVLTLMTQQGVWELAKQHGAFACLAKQYTTGEDLHRAIQRAIANVGQIPKEERHRENGEGA